MSSVFAAALGREAGLVRIAGLQLAGQAGLHGLLAMAHAGHGSATSVAPPAGGHLHSGSLAGGAPLSGSLADNLAAGGWAMLLAHLAAAAVLSGWLLAGERAAWSLIGGLAAAGSGVWSRTVALASQPLEGLRAGFGRPSPVPAGYRAPRGQPAWGRAARSRLAAGRPRQPPPELSHRTPLEAGVARTGGSACSDPLPCC